jgi:pilus assembly protein CpaE
VQHPTRTLVSLDAGIDESASVRAAGGSDIQVVGIVRGVDESWTTLQETPTDLLVIACTGYSERALFLIASVVKARPGMPIVVLAQERRKGFLRRVFEVGADDAVRLPSPRAGQLHDPEGARPQASRRDSPRSQGTAPMICVLGPKGGTGKTVTTTNLALPSRGAGQSVAAVDLDLQFGDLALAMGVRPEKTMYDLVPVGRLARRRQARGIPDAPRKRRPRARRSDAARPGKFGWARVPARGLSLAPSDERLRRARQLAGFTPEVISAIDNSTYVCIVGTLDTLSLKNTRLGSRRST